MPSFGLQMFLFCNFEAEFPSACSVKAVESKVSWAQIPFNQWPVAEAPT